MSASVRLASQVEMRVPGAVRPALALGFTACFVAEASAQRPDPLTTIRDSVLSGVVLDFNGQAVASAQIVIMELRRSMRTTPEGAFWFDSVPPGDYELTFRKLGYAAQTWNVSSRPGGTALVLEVKPAIQVLDPIVARSARSGVGGVVMDTAKRLLRGAEIRLNGGRLTRTDELGRFFVGATPGRYLVHVRHRGHATQFISVTVPRDSGVEIAAWLTPGISRGEAAREAFWLDEFRKRMLVRNPAWSRIFTRDDINRLGFTRLDQIATAGAGHSLSDCLATIEGLSTLPLWSVDAADVEFVEVYTRKPPRPNRGNLRSGPLTDPRPRIGPCPEVHVRLRK
jgi:hypothetical protein